MTTEHVQRMLEDMIPELNDYRNRKLFTNDEIKSITKKRTAFEFQLIRRAPILADYLRFLQYEMNLDLLRRKRKLRMNQVKRTNTVSDYAIVKRIHVLFERSVRKFSNDVNLWMQFIDWSIACGSVKRLTRIFPRALQVHPLVPALWIKAAKHDFEVTGNIDSARVYFQRGLRFNPTSKELWLAFFRMEMRFIGRLIARKAALGLIPTRGLLDKVLQKEAKRQSKRDGEEGKDGNDDDDEDQIAFSKIKVPDSVAVLANRLDASDRAVLSGALPAAIFRNAILTPALARDVEFRLEFLPFISEWQRATEAEHLSKSVARTGGNLNAIKLVSTMATASPDVQARPDRVVDIECLRVAGVRIANVFDAVLFSLARDFPVTPDCVDARARATLVDSDYVDPSSIASTPQDFSSSSSSSAAGAAAGGKKSKKSRIESVIKSASSSSSSSSSSQPSLADSLAGLPEMSAIRVYESAITRASTSTRTSNASKSTAAAIHTLMLKFLHERLTEHSGVAARCFTLYESIQTRRFAPTVTSSSSSSSTSTSSSSSTSTTSSSSSVDVFSTSTSSVTAADLHTADEALAQAAASTRASSALRQTFLAGCLSAHVRHVATLATYRLWIQTLRQSGAVLPTGHVAMGDVAIDKVSDDLFDRSAGGASLVADDDDDEDEDDDDGINNNGAGDMHQVEGRWTKKSSSSSSSSSHGDMVSTDVNVALRAVIAAAIKASTKVRAHAQSAQNAHAGVANGGSADAATAAADAEDEFKTSQVSDLFPLWMEIIDIHRAGYASALAQSLLLHSTKQQQQHQHQQAMSMFTSPTEGSASSSGGNGSSRMTPPGDTPPQQQQDPHRIVSPSTMPSMHSLIKAEDSGVHAGFGGDDDASAVAPTPTPTATRTPTHGDAIDASQHQSQQHQSQQHKLQQTSAYQDTGLSGGGIPLSLSTSFSTRARDKAPSPARGRGPVPSSTQPFHPVALAKQTRRAASASPPLPSSTSSSSSPSSSSRDHHHHQYQQQYHDQRRNYNLPSDPHHPPYKPKNTVKQRDRSQLQQQTELQQREQPHRCAFDINQGEEEEVTEKEDEEKVHEYEADRHDAENKNEKGEVEVEEVELESGTNGFDGEARDGMGLISPTSTPDTDERSITSESEAPSSTSEAYKNLSATVLYSTVGGGGVGGAVGAVGGGGPTSRSPPQLALGGGRGKALASGQQPTPWYAEALGLTTGIIDPEIEEPVRRHSIRDGEVYHTRGMNEMSLRDVAAAATAAAAASSAPTLTPGVDNDGAASTASGPVSDDVKAHELGDVHKGEADGETYEVRMFAIDDFVDGPTGMRYDYSDLSPTVHLPAWRRGPLKQRDPAAGQNIGAGHVEKEVGSEADGGGGGGGGGEGGGGGGEESGAEGGAEGGETSVSGRAQRNITMLTPYPAVPFPLPPSPPRPSSAGSSVSPSSSVGSTTSTPPPPPLLGSVPSTSSASSGVSVGAGASAASKEARKASQLPPKSASRRTQRSKNKPNASAAASASATAKHSPSSHSNTSGSTAGSSGSRASGSTSGTSRASNDSQPLVYLMFESWKEPFSPQHFMLHLGYGITYRRLAEYPDGSALQVELCVPVHEKDVHWVVEAQLSVRAALTSFASASAETGKGGEQAGSTNVLTSTAPPTTSSSTSSSSTSSSSSSSAASVSTYSKQCAALTESIITNARITPYEAAFTVSSLIDGILWMHCVLGHKAASIQDEAVEVLKLLKERDQIKQMLGPQVSVCVGNRLPAEPIFPSRYHRQRQQQQQEQKEQQQQQREQQHQQSEQKQPNMSISSSSTTTSSSSSTDEGLHVNPLHNNQAVSHDGVEPHAEHKGEPVCDSTVTDVTGVTGVTDVTEGKMRDDNRDSIARREQQGNIPDGANATGRGRSSDTKKDLSALKALSSHSPYHHGPFTGTISVTHGHMSSSLDRRSIQSDKHMEQSNAHSDNRSCTIHPHRHRRTKQHMRHEFGLRDNDEASLFGDKKYRHATVSAAALALGRDDDVVKEADDLDDHDGYDDAAAHDDHSEGFYGGDDDNQGAEDESLGYYPRRGLNHTQRNYSSHSQQNRNQRNNHQQSHGPVLPSHMASMSAEHMASMPAEPVASSSPARSKQNRLPSTRELFHGDYDLTPNDRKQLHRRLKNVRSRCLALCKHWGFVYYRFPMQIYRAIRLRKSRHAAVPGAGQSMFLEAMSIVTEDDADENHIAARSLQAHMFTHSNLGWNITPVSPFDTWMIEALAMHHETRRESALYGNVFTRLGVVCILLT